MKTPFSLSQYPRRAGQSLSSPPPGYFDRLPAQVMARVAPPARPAPLAWLLRAPAALRTGLASTLLLGTFAASLWLGGGPATSFPTTATSLDQVPQAQLIDYLTSGETHVDMLDLSELPAPRAGAASPYLHASASELNEALDGQPTPDDPGAL
ncbi:hypothetical protein HHL22_08990 [Hymenobacter sp. RP-2-7]|uniref:Uncharacterized protein n=1 Tax=Hymenobacter polaris TaxID=2682546 RepID=A0A7Y0FM01_9BACT|nr:hypothetical protein [Hymenobacter polaris]NML65338.1 hypothetical protein [Hymenobacter polaris]